MAAEKDDPRDQLVPCYKTPATGSCFDRLRFVSCQSVLVVDEVIPDLYGRIVFGRPQDDKQATKALELQAKHADLATWYDYNHKVLETLIKNMQHHDKFGWVPIATFTAQTSDPKQKEQIRSIAQKLQDLETDINATATLYKSNCDWLSYQLVGQSRQWYKYEVMAYPVKK